MISGSDYIRSTGKNPPESRVGQAKTVCGVFPVYHCKIGIVLLDNLRQPCFQGRKPRLAHNIADHEDTQNIHTNDTSRIFKKALCGIQGFCIYFLNYNETYKNHKHGTVKNNDVFYGL
jgi:hypothetical protein